MFKNQKEDAVEERSQSTRVSTQSRKRNASLRRMGWLCSTYIVFFLCFFGPVFYPSTTSSGENRLKFETEKR